MNAPVLTVPGRAGRVSVTSERLTHAEQVHDLLRRNRGPGWLGTTHGLWILPTDAEVPGVVLAAEIAVDGRRSLQVRQQEGTWRATWIEEEFLPAGTEGADLAVEDAFLSTLPADPAPRMRYRTWWRALPAGGDEGGLAVFRPYVARFVGFEPGEGVA